jgi:rhodanese-related sulfurtransferase
MCRILFFLFTISIFTSALKAQQVHTLCAAEFQKRLKAEKGFILDVRSDWEFESGYIEGAVNADIHEEKFRALVDRLDHSKPCFVYCFSGGRSQEAGAYLISKGYTTVYELRGGISSWQKAGYPITKPVNAK